MPARRHHPTLPPSSFPALAECPQCKSGSAPGDAAIRGTRIGATVEQFLQGRAVDEAYSPEELRYKYPAELEEIEWTVMTLRSLYDFPDLAPDHFEIEREIPLLDDSFQEVTFGTLDYYAGGHLSDLKTGEKRDYRRQMAVLSVGLMDRDGLDRMRVSILWSKFREVQTWEWTRAEAEELIWPVVESQRRGDPARPNSYCSWCSKRETCAARVEAVNSLPALLATQENLAVYMATLTPDARGELLRKIQVAAKWCEDAAKGIETWFMEDPDKRKITGFRLGETKPKRVWRNELEAGAKLADIAREKGKDPDALWDTKLVGSTKVHELLGRSKPVKDLVDSLLFTPDGKPAMVEDWAPVPQVARPAKVA